MSATSTAAAYITQRVGPSSEVEPVDTDALMADCGQDTQEMEMKERTTYSSQPPATIIGGE